MEVQFQELDEAKYRASSPSRFTLGKSRKSLRYLAIRRLWFADHRQTIRVRKKSFTSAGTRITFLGRPTICQVSTLTQHIDSYITIGLS